MEPDAVLAVHRAPVACRIEAIDGKGVTPQPLVEAVHDPDAAHLEFARRAIGADFAGIGIGDPKLHAPKRSEEHTSELQSLMRISYAVFCLNKKNLNSQTNIT